jgi:hypothetical protein
LKDHQGQSENSAEKAKNRQEKSVTWYMGLATAPNRVVCELEVPRRVLNRVEIQGKS